MLSGKTDYPLVIENCRKRGKELPVSKVLLDKAKTLLGDNFPLLILFDALNFNENSSKRVRENDVHPLIIPDKAKLFENNSGFFLRYR